jgi:hypothetical protein
MPTRFYLPALALLLTLTQLAHAQSSLNDLNQQVVTLNQQGDYAAKCGSG